jgi:hypothetical protein
LATWVLLLAVVFWLCRTWDRVRATAARVRMAIPYLGPAVACSIADPDDCSTALPSSAPNRLTVRCLFQCALVFGFLVETAHAEQRDLDQAKREARAWLYH